MIFVMIFVMIFFQLNWAPAHHVRTSLQKGPVREDLPSFIIVRQLICLNRQPFLQEFVELVLRLELTLDDVLNSSITTPRRFVRLAISVY